MTTIDVVQKSLGPLPEGLFIGGGEPATGAEQILVHDPATEEPIASVASATVADGLQAVDAASEAFGPWAATPPRERGEVLRRAFALMTERAEALATLIVLENGKAMADARSEIAYAAEFFRWYSEEAVRSAGTVATAPSGTNRIMVLRQPIGVALLITPWNFPAAMATRKIGPALAAGCTVVLKPASATPLTALAIAQILAEAGVPDGVINVIPSRHANDLASALLDDERVWKLSFTGSTEIGRTLMTHAARTVVNCGMELGGDAPFVVLEDADVDVAVAGAMVAKLRNGGSACTAANRFIVHGSIADEFAHRLADAMRGLTVGPGIDESTTSAPW